MTLLAGLCMASCNLIDPFHTGFKELEPAQRYEARELTAAEPPDERLHVATWNIKFGGARIGFFWECPGDRALMTRDEVYTHLEDIAAAIDRMAPDILMLQEVDVDSKRVAYVDQVQWLLDHTDFNHAVYASQWKADYIPSDGQGRVNSGNAILSKWPIAEATRVALPLIEQQGALTRYFWLRRNILDARLDLPGGKRLRVLNMHTSAFAEDDTTAQQIEILAERMAAYAADDERVVAGGDFNTIPAGSEKVSNFRPDKPEDCELDGSDYSERTAWMDPLYERFLPAVPLEDFRDDNAPHLTYTGDAEGFWDRKLDYLFTNARWAPDSTMTFQSVANGGLETMPLSDHAPLSALLRLDAPIDTGDAQ